MSHQIKPELVHAALVDVAGDGQTLDDAAVKARSAGDAVKDAWGTAADAKSAYSGFWSARDDVGTRISEALLHQASCVAEAADAFIRSDGVMSADARGALDGMATITAPDEE